jgi:hypothetical protein
MRQVMYAKALAAWTVGDTEYKAAEKIYTCSPGETDIHINFPVGEWKALPGADARATVIRLRRQSEDEKNPRIQRFAFEIREEPDPNDELEEAFADIPIKRDGKVVERVSVKQLTESLQAATERMKRLEDHNLELATENEALKKSASAPPPAPAEEAHTDGKPKKHK